MSGPQQCCPLELLGSQRQGMHPMDDHFKKGEGESCNSRKMLQSFYNFSWL